MSGIRQKLSQWGGRTDRSDPLVFVGRKEIIAKVLQRISDLPPTGPRGNTLLIKGAPGAGKTALMGEIRRTVEANAINEKKIAPLIRSTSASGEEVGEVYRVMAQKLLNLEAEELSATTTSATEVSASAEAGVPGFANGSGGTKQTEAKTLPPAAVTESAAIARLNTDGRWGPFDGVVLLWDEIQNIPESKDTPSAVLIQDLHAQEEIPALLIVAGLSTSEQTLDSAGLSRLDAVSVEILGPLSPSECLDCAGKTFALAQQEGLRGSAASAERWAERVAKASDGWPQLLHNYLRGCWNTLAEQDEPSLDTGDLEAAMRAGYRLKEQHYKDRIRRLDLPYDVVEKLYQALIGCPANDARKVVRQTINDLPDDGRADVVEAYETSGSVVAQMLHLGLIERDANQTYFAPIPSLRAFVAENAPDSTREPK